MAKGDDIKIKKKNKAIGKKLAKDPSSVSSRVASLIAAKKRRQSGKRRKCQGMCFSLPTEDDPFNDRQGKEDISTKKNKKQTLKDVRNRQLKGMLCDGRLNLDDLETKGLKQIELEKSVNRLERGTDTTFGKGQCQSLKVHLLSKDKGLFGCPSKFLCSCLNSIRDCLVVDGVLDKEQDKPLFVDSWGIEFWNSYSLGDDMLDNSGHSPSVQQLAWIASTAADHISQKEKSAIHCSIPFLLYLVPSQEIASKVRSVCKPLKAFGVHTVSLHLGTAIEHQIQGLRSCEPEFVIATPDRLQELVLIKAVDISGVSLLVVDLMDSISDCLDVVGWIKESINGNPITVVFRGHSGGSYAQVTQNILRKPFHTLSTEHNK